jgi:hypothetical protein
MDVYHFAFSPYVASLHARTATSKSPRKRCGNGSPVRQSITVTIDDDRHFPRLDDGAAVAGAAAHPFAVQGRKSSIGLAALRGVARNELGGG